MTFRLLMSYGLIAGLPYDRLSLAAPGFVCDLYVYRQRYDDQQHGITRKKESRCFD